jgi:putative sugar O-methyltransferase
VEKAIEILEKSKQNDEFGGASIAEFNIFGSSCRISPSSVYYGKTWSDIISTINKDTTIKKVVEIGGGYGGQCLVANQFAKLDSWLIFDLPEANALQKKYLESNGIKNAQYSSTPTFSSKTIEHNEVEEDGYSWDLLISNYAFSEIDRDLQQVYLENVLKKARHGYMLMNFWYSVPDESQFFDTMSIAYLCEQIEGMKVKQERPQTGPFNCILYW